MSDLVPPHEIYVGGIGSMAGVVWYLALYEAYLGDEDVRALYASATNHESISWAGVTFGLGLHYWPGTATAEAELLAGYDEFFVARGQSYLDARFRREAWHGVPQLRRSRDAAARPRFRGACV